ncbi:hypothetical protein [Marinomonas atlantica]|uniref:hypothetical protein n=1 Tax=Marinomonas atlantica TaxID=1806668 RepID=UPI000833E0B6|nr:hypothetical protein [Marinomonas atlantica]
MNRGIFNHILSEKDYEASLKEWVVELEHNHMYWYDLIENNSEDFNSKKSTIDQAKYIKKKVSECLEKRFIYFICSRKKVRFCTQTLPVLTPFMSLMKLRVLTGREREVKEFVFETWFDLYGNPIYPEFDSAGRFIIFKDKLETINTVYSIHDFLLTFEINLNISSEIHYVGYTKNPPKRPLNGEHGGLTSTLYNISNEENDTIIFFNVFKVQCFAINKERNMEFLISNAMTNEIGTKEEGSIIEKSFIFYFDALVQKKNKKREKSELKNSLKRIGKKNKINELQFYYELNSKSEYYNFSSSKIKPSYRHLFTVRLQEDNLTVTEGASRFEEALA